MSDNKKQSRRLPRQQKGGPPILISRAMANIVLDAVEAILNMQVSVPVTDGQNTLNSKMAQVDISELGLSITMPPQQQPGSGGSGGGMDWQSPKELDPTVAVAAGTFVYVTSQNPLVTTGLVDLVLGTLTTARPGIWQAVQAVPAKTTAGKYNVPQVPLPGAGSAPSGSPLKGDADGTNVFWIPWCPTVYC